MPCGDCCGNDTGDNTLQVDAYGGEDDRPSGYQPRPISMGLSSANSSYSSPQLTAVHDGSEEVTETFLQLSNLEFPLSVFSL